MATSIIKNMHGTETVSVTLTNNFALASWGYCRAYMVGKICIVTFSGLYRATAVDSNTQFGTLSVTASGSVTATAQANNNDMAILQVGGNKLYVNGMQANINYYGMIVFPVA